MKKQLVLVSLGAQKIGRLFDGLDANDNGILEESEGKHFFQIMGAESQAELDYQWNDLVRVADTNADGRISRDEFVAYIMADQELDEKGDFSDEEFAYQLDIQLGLAGAGEKLMARLFDFTDVDGSGFLEDMEGKEYLMAIGTEQG